MIAKSPKLNLFVLLKSLQSLSNSLDRDEYYLKSIKVYSYIGNYPYTNNKTFIEEFKNDKMNIIEIIKKYSFANIHKIKCNNLAEFNINWYNIGEVLDSIHQEICKSELFLKFINKYYLDPENYYDEINEDAFNEWCEKIEIFLRDEHNSFLANLKNQDSNTWLKNDELEQESIDKFFKKTFPSKYISYMFPIYLRNDYYFIRNCNKKPLFMMNCYQFDDQEMIIDDIKRKIALIRNETVDLLLISLEIDQKRYTDEIEECECSIFKKNYKCLNICETFRFKLEFRSVVSNTKKDMCKRIADYIKIFLDYGINEMNFPVFFSCDFNQFHTRLWKENFAENKSITYYSIHNNLFEDIFQEETEIFLTQVSFLSRVISNLKKSEIWNSDIKLSNSSIYKHLSEFFSSLSYESLFYFITKNRDMKNKIKNHWEFIENRYYEPINLKNCTDILEKLDKLFKKIDKKIEIFKTNVFKDLQINNIADVDSDDNFYPIRILKVFTYSYILSCIETNSPKFNFYLAKKFIKIHHIRKIHKYQSYINKKLTDSDIYSPEEFYFILKMPSYNMNYSNFLNPIDIILSSFNFNNQPKKRKNSDVPISFDEKNIKIKPENM